MSYLGPGRHRRTGAAAAVVAFLHLGLGYLLIGRSSIQVPVPGEALILFDVPSPVPKAPKEEGTKAAAASAPSRRAKPKPVSAPKPKVAPETPPSIIAAPAAGTATDTAAGATDDAGSGTGREGEGAGLGSGLGGSGTGRGSGPKRIAGSIRDSDYPRAASRARAGGAVVAHFDVGTDGRVSNCRVISSSGNADLDQTTCRLIEDRFRYQPATDALGRAMPDVAGWRQDWWLERRN